MDQEKIKAALDELSKIYDIAQKIMVLATLGKNAEISDKDTEKVLLGIAKAMGILNTVLEGDEE